jgi:hypothetical protein
VEANSLEEIKAIRDKAEAVRSYAKAAQLGLDAQNHAAEIKLRAERKAGHALRSMNLRGGNRKSKGQNVPLKLRDLGISRQHSKRWQSLASVPEKDFLEYLRSARSLGQEVTSAGLMRLAKKSTALRRIRRVDQRISGECPSIYERLVELENHHQLLSNVLRSVYEGSGLKSADGERRIVGKLLGEMKEEITELLREYKKQWVRSN